MDPDSLEAFVKVAIQCLHIGPKHRPNMGKVVVKLESALALQEKNTEYILAETTSSNYNQEDVDFSKLDMEIESSGKGSAYLSNGGRQENQSSGRMTLAKRFGVFLSLENQSSGRMTLAKRFGVFLSLVTRAFLAKPKLEVLRTSNLRSFSFNDLSVATRNFHPEKKLGQDAFGCFYEGWVDENTFAAAKWGTGLVVEVKKFNKDFYGHEAEINCLGKLCRPNIVKLIGYCLNTDHRLLVYEFMPQRSLDQHLFRENSRFAPLSWKLRMSIALGAAKGLAYLHSTETNVIHRDIKTAYILIDSKYNAKLSGFGLAKDGPEHGQDHVSTGVQGTYGYVAPEYATTGHLTKKIDVYRFGVGLLEILTGKSSTSLLAKEYDPLSWAKGHLTRKSRICFFMDADMQGQYIVNAALKAVFSN